ncbi:Iron-sulfur cluster assembly 2, mitochondrial [Coelomomyces lativittatus]|nr:Iron-sulfur cluster assembly 2, mitochondrial [Coelomomyces lativittatus]
MYSLIEKDGAKVLIDSISLDLIRNAKLDFSNELIAQCFQIVDIPRASTHCGCGTSFQIKD